MIFIDTETTGLLKADAADINFQPYIIELYAVKLTPDYEYVAEIDSMIKPPVPIPEEVVRITNITDEMVANAPPFISLYDSLIELFLGEREVIGHNCPFDMGILYCELTRAGLEFHFPWPPTWTCTVEKSMHLEHRRLKLTQLHQYATGEPHSWAHRAKDDVSALVRCHMWMKEQGML